MFTRACVFMALAVTASVPTAGQVADEAAVPRMSVADLKMAVDAKRVLVVDVRDAASYAEGHIQGSVNVPLDQIHVRAATLKDAKKAIVTYCA